MSIVEGRMPFMGYQTYYRLVGNCNSKKTPLVLIHGGPGSTHNYFELLDQTAEEDDRMFVMYDQIGCGNSYLDGHPELWIADTWVQELIALREYLGLQECHLLGHSWGGMLILSYVCGYAHDGIKSLILSSTLPSSRLWGMEQARMIRELPEDMQAAIAEADKSGNYDTPELKRAEAEFMLRHCGSPATDSDPECLRRPKKKGTESYVVGWGPNEFTPLGTLQDYDVTAQLKDVKEPSLVISGTDDLCTPYLAKTMADGIPDARWELFRCCRHCCMIEDLPRYSKLLKEWLNAHD